MEKPVFNKTSISKTSIQVEAREVWMFGQKYLAIWWWCSNCALLSKDPVSDPTTLWCKKASQSKNLSDFLLYISFLRHHREPHKSYLAHIKFRSSATTVYEKHVSYLRNLPLLAAPSPFAVHREVRWSETPPGRCPHALLWVRHRDPTPAVLVQVVSWNDNHDDYVIEFWYTENN